MVPTPAVSTASSVRLVPAYAGPVGYVNAAPTTVASSTNYGNGHVGIRQPVPVPAGIPGHGAAGIVLFSTKKSLAGSVGSPVASSGVHPSVAWNTVPVASGSAVVPQGTSGTVRGACPVPRAAAPAARVANGPATGRPDARYYNPAKRNLMKLSRYDGTGSLETFLAKFTHMVDYMKWDESHRYHHLCACLDGVAGEILWDVGPEATVANTITLLKTRFGSELQAERFRAELRARRRQPCETLQQLHLDISKLVALAYPAATPELSSHVAKEAFIEALEDPQLQLKVMEREPKSVEDALAFATRLEAYEASLAPHHYDRGGGDQKHRHKHKATYAVEGEETPVPDPEDTVSLIQRQLLEIQAECSGNKQSIDRAASKGWKPTETEYLPSLAVSQVPFGELPSAAVRPVTKNVQLPNAIPFSCAYVNAEFRGRPLMCMLVTGCYRSVIGRRFISRQDLQPIRFSLLAAGRNPLKVDGEATIQFSIDGHPMEAEVSVSPVLDELLLGCDWLTKQRGQWDFATGVVRFGDVEIRTQPKRTPEIACQRLVVAEDFTILPRHEANVPVKMEAEEEPQPTIE